jgi:hypothetical protein
LAPAVVAGLAGLAVQVASAGWCLACAGGQAVAWLVQVLAPAVVAGLAGLAVQVASAGWCLACAGGQAVAWLMQVARLHLPARVAVAMVVCTLSLAWWNVYGSRKRPALSSCSGHSFTMYHGTSEGAARSIESAGFRPSTGGMLGRGVYVSRDIQKARAYGSVILRCRVDVGKVKRIDRQGHPLQQSWHGSYDSAWVPPQCGMVPSGLAETSVLNPSRIRVLGRVF